MNKDAQRIAIAKALGLDVKLCPVHHAYECCGRKIPNYLEDLNACHEMEKVLRDSAVEDYELNLLRLIEGESIICDFSRYPSECLFHATASERCEAFLRTLNLWVESPQHLEGNKL